MLIVLIQTSLSFCFNIFFHLMNVNCLRVRFENDERRGGQQQRAEEAEHLPDVAQILGAWSMSLVASISLLTSQSTDMLLRSHKPDTVIWEDATLKLQVQGGQEVVRKQRRPHRGAGNTDLWLVNWPEYWSVIGAGEVPQQHHHPAQWPGQPAVGLGVRAGASAPHHHD